MKFFGLSFALVVSSDRGSSGLYLYYCFLSKLNHPSLWQVKIKNF